MRPRRMPFLGCFQTQHQHVEDDPHIDDKNQQLKPAWPPRQVGHLEWDVDGARGDRHPLRPRACIPQAVGLDEANDHIDRRDRGDLPQANVADPIHQIDKDSDVVVKRVNVEKFQKAFGYSPDIHAPHGEHTETRENDDDSFRKLNRGYGAHAFDVRGVVDYEMRDSGMRDSRTHLRLKILMQSETGQAPSLHEFFFRFSSLLADDGAQLLCDLQSGFVGGFTLSDIERDCSNARVSAAAVALADSG